MPGIAVDSARHAGPALGEGGAERPERPQAARTRPEWTAAPGAGPTQFARGHQTREGGGGCSRVPSPSQTLLRSAPRGSPLPLTTPYVCSSGKPKFICQIQDTALTVPGFSFCLSLIASGRALLKGKWCVLTGQGPPPGARKRLSRVALPSVSLAQPPYPNGKAVSPGCVSVSAGHVCHTGRRGAGPRSRKREPGRRSVLSTHEPFSKDEV